MNATKVIWLLAILAGGCSPRGPLTADDTFDLNCDGWSDGFSKIGDATTQLGKSTYKTKYKWDGTSRALTTFDDEGPLALCSGIPNEECSQKVEDGFLIGHNTTSGPGTKPQIIVRTITDIQIDLDTMKGVQKTQVLSGLIQPDGTATREMEINQTAQLNCERVATS